MTTPLSTRLQSSIAAIAYINPQYPSILYRYRSLPSTTQTSNSGLTADAKVRTAFSQTGHRTRVSEIPGKQFLHSTAVLAIIPQHPCFGYFTTTPMFWLFCHNTPLLAISPQHPCFGYFTATLPFWLFHYNTPVLAISPQHSCFGYCTITPCFSF